MLIPVVARFGLPYPVAFTAKTPSGQLLTEVTSFALSFSRCGSSFSEVNWEVVQKTPMELAQYVVTVPAQFTDLPSKLLIFADGMEPVEVHLSVGA